jgi:DNA-binding HxlR family transcriptional regulator
VLSETLRTMQRDGLVTRRDLETNPPHVEYSLTPLGLSLLELIDAARSWSEAHLDELVAARTSRIG